MKTKFRRITMAVGRQESSLDAGRSLQPNLINRGAALKILIAGASGFVGHYLAPFLQHSGHRVKKLVRTPSEASPDSIIWNPEEDVINPRELEGFDAVINLCGESIASGRWTREKKKKILDSRVQATITLSNCLAQLELPPKVLLNASAIGYYGNRSDEILTEDSHPGRGFLAEVCKEWEGSTFAAKEKGIRVVCMRLAMVLSAKGGGLHKMLFPFKSGLGGVIGSGRQYMSWIAIDDLLNVIYHLITQDSISGAVNVGSPNPVTNYTFTKTLGNVLNRPTILPLPAWLANFVFGEMAGELLLSSERVNPKKLEETGFVFAYPTLEPALQHLLEKD